MKLTPKDKIITGYKATDKNMCCRGFKFELGKWYEHDGELSMCESGFHFCEYPSGPWCYYDDGRIFEIEAKEVFLSTGPGADLKHVAKKIRLVKETTVDGYGNTGNRNTGNSNTGNRNTGYWNSGNRNTGNSNTGNRNTGNSNTGNRNTGNRNTGNWNTGNWNSGYGNTGNWNSGYGNTGDYHSGCLNFGTAKFYIFNKPAKRELVDFSIVNRLVDLMRQDDPIDPTPFLTLPNATAKAIKMLHEAHIQARRDCRKDDGK